MAVVGNNDTSLSPYLKVWVQGSAGTVCAVIGEGTSLEITANWVSPYEDDSLASQYSKTEAGIQMMSDGRTLSSSLTSVQSWQGNQPYSFNVSMILYALTDPVAEVENAIRLLEEMAAPDLDKLPGGRTPGTVALNIGRRRAFKDCVITNISQPLDGVKDSHGHLIRCKLDVQIQTEKTLMKPEIAGTYA